MTSLKKIVLENGVCPIPWVHAEINGSNSLVYPCCKYKENVGTVQENFSSIWFNDKYKKIRWDLSNGVEHKNCSACDVPNNVFSYKKWKTEVYLNDSILDDIDIDKNNYPKVLHIGGFSNLCNLACRMCNPQSSSTLETIIKKSDLKKFYPLDIENKNLSIDICDDFIDEIIKITISGGEPFLDKQVFEFLKKFKNSKNLKQINFSTNLTKINLPLFDYLSTLDIKITLSVSLDGNKKIHEYIRHGCDYDSIIKNIEIISERYKKFQFNINTTLSAYNAGYANETLESFLEIDNIIKIQDLMISPVLKPEMLHPGVLPDNAKNFYLEKYSCVNIDKFLKIPNSKKLIETSINLISLDYSKNFLKFLEFTETFDKISNKRYLEIYPEMAPPEGIEPPFRV